MIYTVTVRKPFLSVNEISVQRVGWNSLDDAIKHHDRTVTEYMLSGAKVKRTILYPIPHVIVRTEMHFDGDAFFIDTRDDLDIRMNSHDII